jgi:hypothetical protein
MEHCIAGVGISCWEKYLCIRGEWDGLYYKVGGCTCVDMRCIIPRYFVVCILVIDLIYKTPQ